jgi:class 3 adenylate cyclase
VADELKTTGKASAKHYPKVSVLFTDFKGFTARSANMTPEEVIEELNKCFSAFDAIV